jgi:hypothetical protein
MDLKALATLHADVDGIYSPHGRSLNPWWGALLNLDPPTQLRQVGLTLWHQSLALFIVFNVTYYLKPCIVITIYCIPHLLLTKVIMVIWSYIEQLNVYLMKFY